MRHIAILRKIHFLVTVRRMHMIALFYCLFSMLLEPFFYFFIFYKTKKKTSCIVLLLVYVIFLAAFSFGLFE